MYTLVYTFFFMAVSVDPFQVRSLFIKYSLLVHRPFTLSWALPVEFPRCCIDWLPLIKYALSYVIKIRFLINLSSFFFFIRYFF